MLSSKMFLTTLACLVYTSLQLSSSHKTGKCAGRDASNSIRACWTYTKQLLTADMEKTEEEMKPCFGFNPDVSKHQLGVEVMRTSQVICCFAMAKEGLDLPSMKSLDIDTVGIHILPCHTFEFLSGDFLAGACLFTAYWTHHVLSLLIYSSSNL